MADQTFTWLRGMCCYVGIVTTANLVWETLQLPLYTIWQTGTAREQAFAVIHCTLGDFLIALVTLAVALSIAGDRAWPARRFRQVAVLTLIFGVGYTIFSEWLNISVSAAWAYSELMPVLSIGGAQIGLSPLLQWIVLPVLGFALTRRALAGERGAASL